MNHKYLEMNHNHLEMMHLYLEIMIRLKLKIKIIQH